LPTLKSLNNDAPASDKGVFSDLKKKLKKVPQPASHPSIHPCDRDPFESIENRSRSKTCLERVGCDRSRVGCNLRDLDHIDDVSDDVANGMALWMDAAISNHLLRWMLLEQPVDPTRRRVFEPTTPSTIERAR